MANARPGPEIPAIQTATAPALEAMDRARPDEMERPPTIEPEPTRISYQRPLFRELQPVMQIPVLPSAVNRETKPRPARPRPARRAHADQQFFDFSTPKMRTSLEAVIYTDAPVASPVHRLLAAALDLSLVVIALSAFLFTFHFVGGVSLPPKQTLPLGGAIAALLWVFYNLLFVLANTETPGMTWSQLRVVNFDGKRPDLEQRAFRLMAMCLSVLAAGLGLLWALVDEERLTWHDHISKTFVTPVREER